jgi:hypothetical protein
MTYHCFCAACDFDRRLQEQRDARASRIITDKSFHPEDMQLSLVAFAYNMDEYTNVYLEAEFEWCASYH